MRGAEGQEQGGQGRPGPGPGPGHRRRRAHPPLPAHLPPLCSPVTARLCGARLGHWTRGIGDAGLTLPYLLPQPCKPQGPRGPVTTPPDPGAPGTSFAAAGNTARRRVSPEVSCWCRSHGHPLGIHVLRQPRHPRLGLETKDPEAKGSSGALLGGCPPTLGNGTRNWLFFVVTWPPALPPGKLGSQNLLGTVASGAEVASTRSPSAPPSPPPGPPAAEAAPRLPVRTQATAGPPGTGTEHPSTTAPAALLAPWGRPGSLRVASLLALPSSHESRAVHPSSSAQIGMVVDPGRP